MSRHYKSRRVCSFLLSVLLCGVLLAGCGEKEAERPEVSPAPPPVSEPEAKVEIPVDFEKLQEEHPDIYAWLEIPGTEIDYPVVQRSGDDGYYLRKDLDGHYSIAGTIFSESHYNGTDFMDPVTLLYGHNINNDTMFGELQNYVESLTLDESAVFYLYHPERKLTYQIFAGVPLTAVMFFTITILRRKTTTAGSSTRSMPRGISTRI